MKFRIVGMDKVVRRLRNMHKDIEEAMDDGCNNAAEYLIGCIVDKFGYYQPGWDSLKQDTIKRKHSDEPLVETGDMMFSFYTETSNRSRKHTIAVRSDDEKLKYHVYGAPKAGVPMRDPVRPTLKEEHDECIRIMEDAVRDAIDRR